MFPPIDLSRWNRISIGLGGFAWAIVVLARLSSWFGFDDLNLLLLLALCVITPLTIPLVPLSKKRGVLGGLIGLALFLQPFATLIGAVSLFSQRGVLAAGEAVGWLLFTGLLALIGLFLLIQRYDRRLAEASIAAALIYLPIGGAWLVLDRLGLRPLGFSQTTVLLTAVHFHFITLAALIITGLTGRALPAGGGAGQMYRVLASCMLVSPLLVAVGITITQVTGMRLLESAAAILLALCLALIALFTLRFIVPATSSPLARGLLSVSSTAVVLTMLLAGAYALGNATGRWSITISQMIVAHGWINALVFGLCGLLGWRLRYEQRED